MSSSFPFSLPAAKDPADSLRILKNKKGKRGATFSPISFTGGSSAVHRQSRHHTERGFRKNGGMKPSRGSEALGGNLDLLFYA